MSLRTRLLLIFGVGGLFFLFALTLLVFTRMEAVMTEQLHQQFMTDANTRITGLNKSFIALTENFQHSSQLPTFNSLQFDELTLNTAAAKNDIRRLELYFFELLKKRPEITQVQYIDNMGAEVFRVENDAIKNSLSDLSQDPELQYFLKQTTKNVSITIQNVRGKAQSVVWWVPVYPNNYERSGILKFYVSHAFIIDSIKASANTKIGEVCLSNAQNVVVFSTTKSSACHSNEQLNWQHSEEWYFSNSLSLPGLFWHLSIITDPQSFLDDVDELRVLIFGKIFIGTAIFALLFIVFFTTRITNAIVQLAEAARTMGRGEKLPDINVDRDDELGVLARQLVNSASLIENNRVLMENKNRDLEAFSYTLAHDLRSPLRSITGFSQILEMDAIEKLNDEEKDSLARVIKASKRMANLIDDILELSRISNREITSQEVSLSSVATCTADTLRSTETDSDRKVEIIIDPNMNTSGDPQLLRLVLENLMGNAWKYSRKTEYARIHFGSKKIDGITVYYIKDNGIGFDMQYSNKLFKPFQRLHKSEDFEGTGIGLASVKRMIERHYGCIWIKSVPNEGTTLFFTLGEKPSEALLNAKAD